LRLKKYLFNKTEVGNNMAKKNINTIIKETIDSFVSTVIKEDNEYKLQDLDELYGYMWLKPDVTSIDADIFVDDGEAYIRDQHIPLLFVRNGKGKEVTEFIPISISKTPTILDNSLAIAIDTTTIKNIFEFIKLNENILMSMANGKLSADDFVSALKIPAYVVTEEKHMINEMATLRKADSNLPMDVWLDEGGTYQGHAPRIKFRASKEQRNTREFSSMLLTNPPTIENPPSHYDIKPRDLELLKQFVVANMDLLLKLANNEIDYRTQFLPNMIKAK
jgi:hypothetical protein